MKVTTTSFKVVLLITIFLASISIGQISAKASSWHKGTPKELRGTYQGKRTSEAEGFGYIYTISSKAVVYDVSNWPIRYTIHIKYKKLKRHIYRLAGHMPKSDFVPSRHDDHVYYRKGKYLLAVDYTTYKKEKMKAFRYVRKDPAKLTKKIKGGGPIVNVP